MVTAAQVLDQLKREGFCKACGGHLHARYTVRDRAGNFCSQDCLGAYVVGLRSKGVLNREHRRLAIAKRYAHANGYFGAPGGWIYREVPDGGEPVVQGWWSFARMFRRQILDWLTKQLTGMASFQELVTAGGNYRPTLRGYGRRWWWYEALADAYDAEQEERNDFRRAWRARPVGKQARAS